MQSRFDRESATLGVTGEVDISNADRFQATLTEALRRCGAAPELVVDLSGLAFIDSSGVRALVSTHRAATGDGRRLRVVDAGPLVARVLRLTGVAELLGLPDATPHDRGAGWRGL